jgi:hypothetical protein
MITDMDPSHFIYAQCKDPPKGGGGGGGLQAPPQTCQNQNLKNTDFVGIMTSKVLRAFLFSQNEPLKSDDD